MAALAVSVDESFIDRARNVLQILINDPTAVLSRQLSAQAGEYTRHFLFGDGMTSAWAFAWAPGSKTPIHDHHCPCVFSVLDGVVTESWFEQVGEGETVRLIGSKSRDKGHIAALRPSRPNIHRMSNDGDALAITVHIYGFNRRVVASSVDREYLLAT
jgi:predicted metal-dependent enzyme (double-stranded beta helix superfamily)